MAVLNVHMLGNPSGEPLLAIHGVNAHGRRYRRLAEEALTDRSWLAVDLRGHGRSTYDGPWSVSQHVADLRDTLDALDLTAPVDVVGHSFGGLLALALLAADPARVRRVVLLDPALLLPGAEASEIALETMATDGWATVDEALAFRNAGLGDEIHPSVHEEIAEHLVRGEDGRYRFRTHVPAVVTAWGELALPIPDVRRVPTLLVIGERADWVTAEVEATLADRFGDLLHTVRLDCGHLVYWERFDETAAAMAEFLGGLMDDGQEGFYGELARWWPLISPVEEYEEEAAEVARHLESASIDVVDVLELGSGGGHVARWLKDRFRLTLVDLSPSMLAVSEALNPECDHRQGDMRTVRLGRTFDAVLIHDAIAYLLTEDDLAATMRTAQLHCRPGGVVVIVPDDTTETFEPDADHGGVDGPDGRGVRYLEWSTDPDPADTTTRTDYVFLLREADGTARTVHDVHLTGLFPEATWLRLLAEASLEAEARTEVTSEERTPRRIFVGRQLA